MKWNKYMHEAWKEAVLAYEENEVPVGAVIVRDDEIIAKAHNQRIKNEKTSGHAEMIAIEIANKTLNSWRLDDCDIYVTLEPCLMCAGAIQQARIKNVYFGARDSKGGVLGSIANIYDIDGLNHYPFIHPGINEKECSELLKNFFKKVRESAK